MPAGLGDILNDPELLAAFQDPDVSTAFMEISQNPAAAEKYKNNPKVRLTWLQCWYLSPKEKWAY